MKHFFTSTLLIGFAATCLFAPGCDQGNANPSEKALSIASKGLATQDSNEELKSQVEATIEELISVEDGNNMIGTRIDGSEDVTLATAEPAEASATLNQRRPGLDPINSVVYLLNLSVGIGIPSTDLANAGLGDGTEEAPNPNRELGILRADGVRVISFWDLSLKGYDTDKVIDSLLFPEDYDEPLLPANILALHNQEVELTGYMIPGKFERGGYVRDFMLVRDLLGCCFGGIPQPDEWVDVIVHEDYKAEYIRYVPLKATGILTVGEDMSEDDFNPPIFRITATKVERKE